MIDRDEKVDVLVHPASGQSPDDVAKAIEGLCSPVSDLKARADAAERLGRSDGGEQVVSALIGALKDPYAEVRGTAAFALGRIGHLRAVGPLVSMLQDPSDDVRCRAAVALGLIGSLSVLRRAPEAEISTEDQTIRWGAIQALGQLGPPAVDCLAKALKHGPRSERARVVVALGETHDVSAVGPLLEVLEDPDEEVRTRSREALEKIRESRVF